MEHPARAAEAVFALGNDYNGNSNSVSLSTSTSPTWRPDAARTSSSARAGPGRRPPARSRRSRWTRARVSSCCRSQLGNTATYNNGLQLIEFTPDTQTLAGTAKTHGWVERGIFVGNRLVSLSDLALSVVDYTDPMNPSVITELTLARNVITAQPRGETIAEISSDWWAA